MISAVMPTYARADVVFERGEGAYLFDGQGRRYLDFVAGVAVTALGHCHPRLVAALTEQAGKVWHTSNLFRVAGQERLARRLVESTFAHTAFFTNSGAEAWECGAKLVRKYFYDQGQPQRHRIITCAGAFHGRTLAAISAAQQEKLIKGFAPLLEGFDQVPFGDLDAMRAAVTGQTAAICVEPVQGEGGVRVPPKGYLQGLREIADEFGLLLFLDEIQTGFGRTGKLFAHEWEGITPDVMCIAKGLGGGFPVGACLATAKAAAGMGPGTHGSTYGGNPLAMAVGWVVLDEMLKPEFLPGVTNTAERLAEALAGVVRRHPTVFRALRGTGMLLGLEAIPANTEVIDRLRCHGLLAPAAGDNVVRMLPPLIIGDAEISEAVAILDRVAASFEQESAQP